jgi:small-conductance mechanosensitive channel
MQILDSLFLGNTVRSWLVAAAVAAGLTIGLRIGVAIALRRLRRIAGHTKNDVDDIAVDVLANTKFYFVLFLGLLTGSRWLDIPEEAQFSLKVIAVLAIVFQTAAWSNVAITAFIKRRVRQTVDHDPAEATTMAALGFLIRLVLWSVLLLAALSNLGIEIGPLLTGLGVGGVAVALAVQNVLGDLFASLSIVLDKPFVLGDFIVVDDMAGTIENVGLKTTRVRSLSGEQLVFSNSDLLKSRIRNYKRMQERRILFKIGVTYQTSRDLLEKIPALIREILEKQDNARYDRAHFKGFGDFSLDFEVVYYVRIPDYNAYMDTQQAINLELHRRFEEMGIEFAYPTQTLFMERVSGDRAEAAT